MGHPGAHALAQAKSVLRYFTATLVDLVVLNLFIEYWPQYVAADAFTITLLAAVLLQILLKLTHRPGASRRRLLQREAGRLCEVHALLHRLADSVRVQVRDSRSALLAFGDGLRFGGPFHGIVALIAVVVAMLVAEVLLVKLYRRLG